jgi:hypothetical protein
MRSSTLIKLATTERVSLALLAGSTAIYLSSRLGSLFSPSVEDLKRTMSVDTRCRMRCDRALVSQHQLRGEAGGNGFFAAFAEPPGVPGFSTGISGKIALRSKASRDYGVNSFIRAILAWAIARARSKIRSSDPTRAISRKLSCRDGTRSRVLPRRTNVASLTVLAKDENLQTTFAKRLLNSRAIESSLSLSHPVLFL